MNNKKYVQYGAGDEYIDNWINFDSSPTLRVQKLPIFGKFFKYKASCIFDSRIRYGNIIKGLPLQNNSIDGMFCSHVLEHLTYSDCLIALENTYKYLKPGGRFRIIVPDLLFYINKYNKEKKNKNFKYNASNNFCEQTYLGTKENRSFKTGIRNLFGGSKHLWMWDYESLKYTLTNKGFHKIKKFQKNNCNDKMFLKPERDHQFGSKNDDYGLAIECFKPNNVKNNND